MKDRKILTLNQPVAGIEAGSYNLLAQKLRWYDPILEPCYAIGRGIKSLLRAFLKATFWFFMVSGICAWALGLYFGSMYYRGYAELMLVSNDEVNRYSNTVLEAPKKVGKKDVK